jgi:hypothetical protein
MDLNSQSPRASRAAGLASGSGVLESRAPPPGLEVLPDLGRRQKLWRKPGDALQNFVPTEDARKPTSQILDLFPGARCSKSLRAGAICVPRSASVTDKAPSAITGGAGHFQAPSPTTA